MKEGEKMKSSERTMNSFIKTNDRLINLKNVSNINVIRNFNKDQYRIIFNMNYNIEIKSGHHTKLISDYVYWDVSDSKELEDKLESLESNEYFNENFIDQVDDNGYVNINEISSVKFIAHKNRVIFNLSHPVTFTDFDSKDKITSEFVYVNCNTQSQFSEYVKYLSEELY